MAIIRPLLSATLLVALGLPAWGEDDETPVLRTYDLADLVEAPSDVPPAHLGFVDADTADPIVDRTPPTTTPKIELASFLTSHFEPGIAARLRPACELFGGTNLLLNEVPAMHRHVAEVLARIRAQARLQVVVTARLYLMKPGLRQSRYGLPGLRWRELPNAPGQLWADLARSELVSIDQTLADDHDAAWTFDLTTTTFVGHSGNAASLHQLAYAKLTFSPAGQKQVLGVLNYGDVVETRVAVTSDHGFVHLILDHRTCGLITDTMIDDAKVVAEQPIIWQGGEHLDTTIAVDHGAIIATDLYESCGHDGKPIGKAGFLLIRTEIIDSGCPQPTQFIRHPAANAPPNGHPPAGKPATPPPSDANF